jgi:hypothetical protein
MSVATEYEEVMVDPGYTLLPDTTLDPSGDFLYVLSTSKVTPPTFKNTLMLLIYIKYCHIFGMNVCVYIIYLCIVTNFYVYFTIFLINFQVLKIKVEHCSSFSNCSSCLKAKDPYCGWCSLEKR